MPAKNISFGNFGLTAANGVYVAEVREMSPAQRDLSILAAAGSRGVKVLRAIERAKTIEVRGLLLKDTEANFIAAARAFNQSLMNEGIGGVPAASLTIQTSDGTFLYDDAILLNPEDLFEVERSHNIVHIPFRAAFLCPKGFARSATKTTNSYTITSTPYANSVTINGTANPEPVLTFTFTTPSTITDLTFLNTTTNEQIAVSGLTLVAGDKVTIDIASKTVKQNTTAVKFTGIFPSFFVGLNNYTVTFAGASNTVASQAAYDSDRQVYGSNWLSQEFQVGSTGAISQIALLLRQVSSVNTVLYDDFSGSLSAWTTTGTGRASVVSGKARLGACDNCSDSQCGSGANQTITMTQNANLSAAGDGCQFDIAVFQSDNQSNSYMRGEFTDGTDYIRVEATGVQPSNFTLTSTAYYGSLNLALGSNGGTLEIIPNGSGTDVYWNGVLKASIAAVTKVNSYMRFYGSGTNGSTPNKFDVDNCSRVVKSNANSDLTVEIRTDSTGVPSGTVVTNGSLTVPASSVGSGSFSEIIAAFATSPSLTASTAYHLVIRQSGGDVNNYYQVKASSTGGYASGTAENSVNSGSAWSNQTDDLYFKVYSPAPSSFSVGLAIDHYPSHYAVV
jgi:hypothetical protein